MVVSRALYRLRQVGLALYGRAGVVDLALARALLGEELYALFVQMRPGEQAHSLDVLRKLDEPGIPAALRQAALLHDVGKSRRPLRLWERAWIVICKALAPQAARRWGQAAADLSSLPGWQQPLAVAELHPAWGAEMAEKAGADQIVVNLIRAHQNPPPAAAELGAEFSVWLRRLQAADDES